MHDSMMKGAIVQDPDVAFAKSMTAHHEGAIEMAKTQLKYGKDLEMRKLAEDIIKAPQPEIDQMQVCLTQPYFLNAGAASPRRSHAANWRVSVLASLRTAIFISLHLT